MSLLTSSRVFLTFTDTREQEGTHHERQWNVAGRSACGICLLSPSRRLQLKYDSEGRLILQGKAARFVQLGVNGGAPSSSELHQVWREQAKQQQPSAAAQAPSRSAAPRLARRASLPASSFASCSDGSGALTDDERSMSSEESSGIGGTQQQPARKNLPVGLNHSIQ
jgi:hypothetical protein